MATASSVPIGLDPGTMDMERDQQSGLLFSDGEPEGEGDDISYESNSEMTTAPGSCESSVSPCAREQTRSHLQRRSQLALASAAGTAVAAGVAHTVVVNQDHLNNHRHAGTNAKGVGVVLLTTGVAACGAHCAHMPAASVTGCCKLGCGAAAAGCGATAGKMGLSCGLGSVGACAMSGFASASAASVSGAAYLASAPVEKTYESNIKTTIAYLETIVDAVKATRVSVFKTHLNNKPLKDLELVFHHGVLLELETINGFKHVQLDYGVDGITYKDRPPTPDSRAIEIPDFAGWVKSKPIKKGEHQQSFLRQLVGLCEGYRDSKQSYHLLAWNCWRFSEFVYDLCEKNRTCVPSEVRKWVARFAGDPVEATQA